MRNIVPQNNMADEEEVGEVQVQVLMDGKNSKIAGDSKKSNTVCFFYARSRRCRFGKKCMFVHSEFKPKTLEVTSASGKSPVDVDVAVGSSLNENEEISKSDSSETVTLTQESTEKTSHDKQDFQNDVKITSKEIKSTSRNRCRFFFTEAGCARGNACKFSHTKPNSERKPKKKSHEPIDQSTENKINEKETKKMSDKVKSSTRQSNGDITKVVPTSTRLSMLDGNELKKLRTRELTQVERGFGKLGLKTVQENNDTIYYINFRPSDPDWPFDVETIVLVVTFPEDYPKMMFRASLSEEQDLPMELIRFTNEGISKWLHQQQKARNTKDTVDLPFRPFLRWLDRNIEKLFIEAAKEMRKNEEETLDLNESHNEEGNHSSEGMESMEYGEVKGESDVENKMKDREHYDYNGIEKKNQQQQKRKNKYDYSYSSSERPELQLSDFLTFKKTSKIKGCKGAATSKNSHGNSTQREETKKDHIVFVDQDLSMRKNDNQMLGKTKSDDVDVEEDGDVLNLDYQKDEVAKGVPLKGGEDVSNELHKGTEIRFKGLELSENTSTLTTDSVALTMECLKCKTKMDTKVEKSRSSAIRCSNCSRVLQITFRPSIIHQYSATLGYLDLKGWHPIDLILTEIQLTAGCLACSHETSIKGPHYGSNQVWCSKCHQKLAFSLETTRFFELTPTGVPDKNEASKEKSKKKPKAPGLKEGFPLPDNGICKHYKKSFRWMRFPCCGKCYPCDACHEEHEDHEIKFANRMVCGFCSKEQPYSQSACVACKSFTTKAKTSHWEGGKGCRNKTSMSKGDDKKFKNTMKTTSRKAQAKETPKAKAH